MIDLKELREATENITSGKALFRYANVEKLKTNFTMATKPSVILELLNRLEAAERVCDAAKEFCETTVYVQSEYTETGHNCLTNTDAVAKIRHFVKQWQEVVKCADQQQKK